jgi:hypothetical protein
MEPIQIKRLPENITLRLSGDKVVLPKTLRAKIDKHWQTLLQSTSRFTNGEVFTVVGVQDSARGTDILLAETDYAHYMYSHQAGNLGEHTVRIIHSAAMVITGDDKLIFGSMSKYTSRPGTIQTCGGGFDHKDARGQVIDVEHNIASELEEELGINLYDQTMVGDFSTVYLKYGGPTGKMTICYVVHVKPTSAAFMEQYHDFVERLKAQDEEPEFEHLFSLDRNQQAIDDFIAAYGDRLDEFMPILLQTMYDRGTL